MLILTTEWPESTVFLWFATDVWGSESVRSLRMETVSEAGGAGL